MLSVTPEILIDLPWGQLLVNGLALGSLYALTAFGIVLIFKTTQVITFAQGETAMFSTFVAFTLLTALQLPFAVAFVVTMLFAGLFGALIERVVLRRISTTTMLNPVIVTVGLSLILLGAAGWIWGMGTAMGAVTGMLIAPINYLDPGMMGDVALKAFAAAVVGGLTSLPGAVLGGLLLGIIDSVAGFEVAELRNTIAFALIVLVLVVRPAGLLGRHETKKV